MAVKAKPVRSDAANVRRGARSAVTGGWAKRSWKRTEGLFDPSPQSLAAAQTVTLGSIVAYDLMGLGNLDKKLPRPGPIVATVAFYSILAFGAAASATLRPAIVASGWVLALAVLVTGKRGQGLVGLLAGVARLAAKTGPGNQGGGG